MNRKLTNVNFWLGRKAGPGEECADSGGGRRAQTRAGEEGADSEARSEERARAGEMRREERGTREKSRRGSPGAPEARHDREPHDERSDDVARVRWRRPQSLRVHQRPTTSRVSVCALREPPESTSDRRRRPSREPQPKTRTKCRHQQNVMQSLSGSLRSGVRL